MAVKPEIIYEDEAMLVVNKPAGLTVIPDRVHVDRETVQSILEKEYGKLFVVHRIDRDTSGVLCFARNETAHRALSIQFQNHEVRKLYKAVVKGRMSQKEGEITAPIAESNARSGTMIIHKQGKDALTLYKVEEEFAHVSVLQVQIKTGRTHQIRVHMAHIGHPLLVDPIYAEAPAFFLSSIKRKYKQTGEEERPTISRLTLHAWQLGIGHPVTGQQMEFTAPLPKDMETLLKILRKNDSLK